MDRREIKLLLNYLDSNVKHLSSLQCKFIASLKERYRMTGVITQKEMECLTEMQEMIPSLIKQEAEVYGAESDRYQAQYSSFDYGTFISSPY
jgi:hypothetical protein